MGADRRAADLLLTTRHHGSGGEEGVRACGMGWGGEEAA
jgi:hypothetical protein